MGFLSERAAEVAYAIAGRTPNARGKVRTNCPFCVARKGKADRRQSLQVNKLNGWWDCFRCGSKGRLPGDYEEIVKPEPVKVEPMTLPDEYIPLWTEAGMTSMACQPAFEYLATRNVGQNIIEAARIGACARGRMASRIVVPIDNVDGSLAGWVARAWTKEADRKYLYASGMARAGLIYNGAVLQEESDIPVLVVEGVFDTFPFWPDGVAVLGKPGEGQIKALAEARRPVAVVLDGDAWEEGMWLAYRLRFEGAKAGFVKLPPGKDPDEMQIDQLIEDAKACVEAA